MEERSARLTPSMTTIVKGWRRIGFLLVCILSGSLVGARDPVAEKTCAIRRDNVLEYLSRKGGDLANKQQITRCMMSRVRQRKMRISNGLIAPPALNGSI